MLKRIFKKEEKVKVDEIVAFMDGELISIVDVEDEVFSKKMLGDGFAIRPINGDVYAPISGEVVTVFPTGHAYGLRNSKGLEVLIHLGIDTVAYDGEGFTPIIKVGELVTQGQLICTMDLKFFEKNEVLTTSMLVLTQGEDIELFDENVQVKAKESGIVKIVKD